MPTELPPRRKFEPPEPEWLAPLEAFGVVIFMYAQMWWTYYNLSSAIARYLN